MPPNLWIRKGMNIHKAPGHEHTLARALFHTGPLAARVLGLPEDALVPRHRSRLRFWRRTQDPWERVLRQSQKTLRRIRHWTRQVANMRWTQADVLQVMEEIGIYMGLGLHSWVGVTVVLADLLAGADAPHPLPPPREVHTLLHAWDEALAAADPTSGVDIIVRTYPQLAALPFEAACPRWSETPDHLADQLQRPALNRPLSPSPKASSPYGEWLEIREQLRMALIHVIAAAREWALIAAREATSDGRLTSPEHAFFLTLEELKQLMTGEWNRADQVQPVVEQRRSEMPEVNWRHAWPRIRTDGTAVAVGWHPGWAISALQARRLVTRVDSPLGYARLLAAALGISAHVEEGG